MTPARPLWTADALEQASGGRWINRPAVLDPTRVSYDVSDPRLPGDIVVLRNPRHWAAGQSDDVSQLPELAQNGIAAAILDQTQYEAIRERLPALPMLIVGNTRKALTDLCQSARRRFEGRVIGLTGTAGKTTTREMLGTALCDQGGCITTRGNNNNIAGCDRTMAFTPQDAGFAVVEMGFGRPLGGISTSARHVRPHVAVITNIDTAHLEAFDTSFASTGEAAARVAEEKLGLLDGLTPDGVLVFNREDPHAKMAENAARTSGHSIFWFAMEHDADARLLHWTPTPEGSDFTAQIADKTVQVRLPVAGRHMVQNALCTLAIAHCAGADLDLSAEALARFKPVRGRSDIRPISLPDGGTALLIDDSFNACANSMAASFDLLEIKSRETGGRKIAVLGDMLQLGNLSEEIHRSVLELAVRSEVDRIYATGEMMRICSDGLPSQTPIIHDDDLACLYDVIVKDLKDRDVITVKSSHGTGTSRIAQGLIRGARRIGG